MPAQLACTGAVLAGGASSRMGTDKAFIEIDGVPMVVRAVAALRSAGVTSTLVVGGDRARLRELGLAAVGDRHPRMGPLGAIITALDASGEHAGVEMHAVVTLPCDVVEPDAAAVRSVLDRLVGAAGSVVAADVVVPLGGGVPQWMHAAWLRRSRDVLADAFARGVRAPSEAAQELRSAVVEVPGTGWFHDADCPQDLPPGARAGLLLSRDGGERGESVDITDIEETDIEETDIEETDIEEIDVHELERRRAAGAAVFDVREVDEYEEVRIPGAVLVPLGRVPDSVEAFREAAVGAAVCVVCAVGGRSAQAVAFLRACGVDAVNVAGGTSAWRQAGKPVQTGTPSA